MPRDGSQRYFLDNDPYYWITYARQMAGTGQWRIRYTYVDNVPYGREVHWSQSVTWTLVGFGYARHLLTGESMYDAIEGASIWVNPFLLVLFAIGFSWPISRRMGVAAGAFFMLTFVTLPDVHWAFHPFHVGHHGFHMAFSLGAALCLVLGGLGWVAGQGTEVEARDDGRLRLFRPLRLMGAAEARRYFAAAGVFTGLGLWIGATVQFFSISTLAAGAALLAFFMPARLTNQEADYVPELWRIWAVSASLVGAVFYLVEYFPSHLGMRLEVNNPAFIIGALCVGELATQLGRWRLGRSRGGVSGLLEIAVPAAGAALVPLLFVFGPVAWHNMRDVVMLRLHRFIVEFLPYANFNAHEDPLSSWFVKYYGILPFFLIGALAVSGPRRTKLHEWAALWISFWLCVFSLLLALWQVRWAGLYAAMSVWLMIVVGHIAWRNILAAPSRGRPIGIAVFLSALVLAQAAFFTTREFVELGHIRKGETIKMQYIDAAMKKYLAQGLGTENRVRPMRVLSDPDLTPALYYFGGIQAVTSFYWENLQGLHDATAFFTDHGDAVARRIAKERGLMYVIAPVGERLATTFNYIDTGIMSAADAQSTLLARLSLGRRDPLPWIRLDEDLTRVGRREFSLTTAEGVVSMAGRATVYRLEPAGGAEGQSDGK
ncbi:MAG TPA: hypothetical protein VMV72_04850 [Verrucomicrobiae bacterium]|nr:hypothetical protein [Verrucomicrobiae bacterium]